MADDRLPLRVCRSCSPAGAGPAKLVRRTPENKCIYCRGDIEAYFWKQARSAYRRSTLICFACAELLFVCQSCLLDLTLEVPEQFRPASLSAHLTTDTLDSRNAYRSGLKAAAHSAAAKSATLNRAARVDRACAALRCAAPATTQQQLQRELRAAYFGDVPLSMRAAGSPLLTQVVAFLKDALDLRNVAAIPN